MFQIEELFIDAANSTFGPEYEIEIDCKKHHKNKYNKETLSKKTAYNKAKRQNKPKYRTIATSENVIKASREYKKTIWLENLKEIRNRNKIFRSKNVKDRKYFWSMLSNKKRKSKVMPNLN